jgi:acyl carrier protein
VSSADLTATVMHLVADRVEIDAEVTPTARLVEDLGLDSLARAELWVAVEDAWQCKIPDRDAERLTSVDGIVAYLRERGLDSRG